METGLVVNVPDFIEAGQKIDHQHCRRNLRFSCLISRKRSFYGNWRTIWRIVIAPRVLEKIIAIATAKVEGVHSFSNKSVSDTLSKLSLGRGVYLKNFEENLTADIYLYLEYGVKVPKVAVAIQKAVKDAVRDMADVELTAINIHVTEIVPDKTPKPELKDLFNEDFLND